MMMVGVVRVGMIGEEVVFECASEMDETLFILNVIYGSDSRLSVRPQRTILLLLEVLLQLQVVESIR